jgi:hypothetical protein
VALGYFDVKLDHTGAVVVPPANTQSGSYQGTNFSRAVRALSIKGFSPCNKGDTDSDFGQW